MTLRLKHQMDEGHQIEISIDMTETADACDACEGDGNVTMKNGKTYDCPQCMGAASIELSRVGLVSVDLVAPTYEAGDTLSHVEDLRLREIQVSEFTNEVVAEIKSRKSYKNLSAGARQALNYILKTLQKEQRYPTRVEAVLNTVHGCRVIERGPNKGLHPGRHFSMGTINNRATYVFRELDAAGFTRKQCQVRYRVLMQEAPKPKSNGNGHSGQIPLTPELVQALDNLGEAYLEVHRALNEEPPDPKRKRHQKDGPSKLTRHEVRDIRSLPKGKYSAKVVAARYNVSAGQIRDIWRGATQPHVP